MTNTDYISIEDIKIRLVVDENNQEFDDLLAFYITAASRAVDDYCGRRFYKDATVSSRTYTMTNDRLNVFTEEFSTLTGLVVRSDSDHDGTYETLHTINTDYWVTPPSEGRPYNSITFTFPLARWMLNPRSRLRELVQVTAQWGWSEVPSSISHATLVWAQRLWNRKDSPSGIMGFGDQTAIRLSRMDPDVMTLLGPYKKAVFA